MATWLFASSNSASQNCRNDCHWLSANINCGRWRVQESCKAPWATFHDAFQATVKNVLNEPHSTTEYGQSAKWNFGLYKSSKSRNEFNWPTSILETRKPIPSAESYCQKISISATWIGQKWTGILHMQQRSIAEKKSSEARNVWEIGFFTW